MAVTIKKLIEILAAKSQTDVVEFMICRIDGSLVAVDVAGNTADMIKALKLFGGGK